MIGAVDIGGTKIAVGVVDEDGRVLARGECPTDAQSGLADGLRRITEMLRQAAAQAGGNLRRHRDRLHRAGQSTRGDDRQRGIPARVGGRQPGRGAVAGAGRARGD